MDQFANAPDLPFLASYCERRRLDTASAALGTETFTKARENSDTDVASARDLRHHAETLGTQTRTEAREQTDADEPRRRVSSCALGTETDTAAREDGDADQPARGSAASVTALGTETFTRARENGDTDAAPVRQGLWIAQLL